MPKQYKVKGASLDAIRLRAEQQYGPGARIVSAEKVTSPGIAGLFAANRFEATIEVQVEAPTRLTGETHALQGPAIAALLKQADAAEIDLHRPSEDVSAAAVSTASPDFAGMLEQLGKEIQAPVFAVGGSTAVPVPVPLAGSGDLVILLGVGDDALGPALEMSIAQGGSDVRTAGALTAFGHLHVAGRQGATAARAQAVLTGQSVLLAYGLGRPGEAAGHVDEIAALAGDQLWLVADAGRKADDTAAWVGALSAALSARNKPLDALAVFGASETASPETVNGLGLPVGWVDGKPARVAVLGKVD